MTSAYLNKIYEELQAIRGKALAAEEREKSAIALAALLQQDSLRRLSFREKRRKQRQGKIWKDPQGRAYILALLDQTFRSQRFSRRIDQLLYLLKKMEVPASFSWEKKIKIKLLKSAGRPFSYILAPMLFRSLHQVAHEFIAPGDPHALSSYLHVRHEQGIAVNLMPLGDESAEHYLNTLLNDLARDEVHSVTLSPRMLSSHLSLFSWESTLNTLSERLRKLYRRAMKTSKGVILDADDLYLTKELFKHVLQEEEFLGFTGGIMLPAYLPESFLVQQELTKWSQQRQTRGAAPIRIHLVKGAHLGRERIEASKRGWPQSPYTTKEEVDANFKAMLAYGAEPAHLEAVHLSMRSHNPFEIAYALVLRAESGKESAFSFEMVEGLADLLWKSINDLSGKFILCAPVATNEEWPKAAAYLLERFDEQMRPMTLMPVLKPGSKQWEEQAHFFARSCQKMKHLDHHPRRTQDRHKAPREFPLSASFENEPDTDFSLKQNRQWAEEILKRWKKHSLETIPLCIDGSKIVHKEAEGRKGDPALYFYTLASWEEIDRALTSANAHEEAWSEKSVEGRCLLLSKVAQKIREKRSELIGVLIADTGKALLEADTEISQAIDFIEYYVRSMEKMAACPDIAWHAKGTILIVSSWNFPISFPAGDLCAALVAGNAVLFKPAPEAVLCGWMIANLFWEAGISSKVLQFVVCTDDPVGNRLVSDERINGLVLTGSTATARHFLHLKPTSDLIGKMEGKNALIITSLADREQAIKDLVYSAFSYSGQKCSTASLAIVEAEVYDDPAFRNQLKEAVQNLIVNSAWNLNTQVTPLIRMMREEQLRALTTLEEGEQWLVQPVQDSDNPTLWSPGVKLGVKEGSHLHQEELLCPLLGLMRAKNLDHAIALANHTPFTLTAGLHSLDVREQKRWLEKIRAGNCYINCEMTGAVVRTQPFGGGRASSFGRGTKSGGPNYVAQFARPNELMLPQEKEPVNDSVNTLTHFVQKEPFTSEELGIWFASVSNYAHWAKRFAQDHDAAKILGEDHLLRYRPYHEMTFRIQDGASSLDVFRVLAAALSCGTRLEISWTREACPITINDQWPRAFPLFRFVQENKEKFEKRLKRENIHRVRLLSTPSVSFRKIASDAGCFLNYAPVLSNGRFELLHYLREITISQPYHRYGNLIYRN